MIRIGIAGCGRVSRIHLGRMLARDGVEIVGLTDPDLSAAQALADSVPGARGARAFSDHREMLSQTAPQVVAIFAPHRAHYRLAMDALQAGCHVFIETPLSTNSQEAADIVGLARGRGRTVGVGHQYRLRPSLLEARKRLTAGEIGRIRMVTATLSDPWLARHQEKADAWRLDPRLSGGGILADIGDHLLDSLLWMTGQTASEVAAFQSHDAPGLDIVTSALIRLTDGTQATLTLTGVCSSELFELTFFGESGRICVGDTSLSLSLRNAEVKAILPPSASESIDENFLDAIASGKPPCCPAEEAVDTVRLLEAITRSAISGQIVRLD